MRIYIKSVDIGSFYDITSEIGDFEIEGQLKSGKIIEIFDHSKYDLRNFENKYIDCLLWAFIDRKTIIRSSNNINQSDSSVIFGKFIKKYQIPSKWKNYQGAREVSAIENEDGIFLFKYDKIKDLITEEDIKFGLKVIRYDLLDWLIND